MFCFVRSYTRSCAVVGCMHACMHAHMVGVADRCVGEGAGCISKGAESRQGDVVWLRSQAPGDACSFVYGVCMIMYEIVYA